MNIIITILVALVAFSHIIFGLTEMFGNPEMQSKAFDFAIEDLKIPSTRLGLKNQGIYNITFGLMGFYLLGIQANWQVLAALMAFVVLVGIYGGATVTKKIYLVQATSTLITLLLLLVFH